MIQVLQVEKLHDVSVILSLSEESDNVSITVFCLCSQILHYVQNDRDRQNTETLAFLHAKLK